MYPRMALKVIFALVGIGLLIQNGLLAETAIDTLSQKEALEILAITLAIVPILWAVFTIPGQSAAHLFDNLSGSGTNNEKIFITLIAMRIHSHFSAENVVNGSSISNDQWHANKGNQK